MSVLQAIEKKGIRDRIFDLGWIVLLLALILNLTAWDGLDYSGQTEAFLKMMRIISLIIFLVVVAINFLTRQYRMKWVAVYAAMAILFGISFLCCKNTTLLFYFVVFAAAYRQDSKRITTIAAIITGGILFLNILGSYLGFSVNFLFSEGTRPRYGLGFSWTTSAAILFFFFLLEYIYLRKEKMHWWEYAILEAINLYLFLMTDSRMAFVLSSAFLLFFFFEHLRKKPFGSMLKVRWLLVLLPALLAMIALVICFVYKPATPGWSELDDFLSNRLYYGNKAIQNYGVTMFGTDIKWIGYDINNLTSEGYNYVDCSYLQILLQFGVAPVIYCVFLYCAGVWRAVKAKDGWLVCVFVIIALFSITEPRYMNLAFNIFPVLIFAYLNARPAKYKRGALKETFSFYPPLEPRKRSVKAEIAEAAGSESKTFTPPSIRLNFVMNVLLSVSSFIFPLITFPYISRILGPSGTGVVNFAFSIVSYFCIISQLGIPTYGIRAIAKVRDDKKERTKVAHELFFLNLIMTVISYILLFVAIFVVPQMRQEKTLFIIAGLTIILSAIGMEWLYKGMEQYRYITMRTLLFKAIAAVAMFLLIKSSDDYLIYGIITVFSGSASFILNFIHARKIISFKWQGGYNLKRHLKATITFFALACATTVYTSLDAGMLGFMKGNEEVGFYNAAVKVKTIMLGIITSLGAVLLPRASYYVERGMEKEFHYLGRKSLNFTVLLASPIFIYFIIFAKEGILTLSGEAFTGSILPMQIIMPTVLLIGITNILGFQILTPMDRESVVFRSVCAGAIIDIILNILLIPRLGSAGAAIGTLAAELVVLIYQLIALKQYNRMLFSDIKISKIVIAIVVGIVLTLWVKILPFDNLILIIISAIVFFGAYYAMLMIMKEPFVRDISRQTGNRIKTMIADQKQH